MLEAPKLGSRVAHDMHSRAGADYGELLLEAKEVDDSAIGAYATRHGRKA